MLTNKPILDTTDYLLKAQTLPLEMASYAATIWFSWMFKPWSGSIRGRAPVVKLCRFRN